MDEAGRGALLDQSALESPDGAEPDSANQSNMNALADGVLITALTITSLAILARVHYWVFISKQLRGRLEAGMEFLSSATAHDTNKSTKSLRGHRLCMSTHTLFDLSN